MPNTDMLKESPFAQKFGFRNSIEVNDYLQVTSAVSYTHLTLPTKSTV